MPRIIPFSIFFLYALFVLTQKGPKKSSQKQMLRCFWQANAHEQSENL
jgi:hypothetical protein